MNKTSNERLESALLNTLSSTTVLSRELAAKLPASKKIEIFEAKRQFLAANGIAAIPTEELAAYLYELNDLLKDFIVLYEPRHAKAHRESIKKSLNDSIVDSKERKAVKTKSAIEREILSARKSSAKAEKLSPHLKLMNTVSQALSISLTELHGKSEKELKRMLADAMSA